MEAGGDIASIHDLEENSFVSTFILDRPVRGGEKDTWIAGSIKEAGGEFSWMDGSPWDFENWDLGETFINTSLAAKGALAHRLQRRTICNTLPPASMRT